MSPRWHLRDLQNLEQPFDFPFTRQTEMVGEIVRDEAGYPEKIPEGNR